MTDEEMIEFANQELVFDGKKYITVDNARRLKDVSPIVKRFGAWAVTTYGIECLVYHYQIEMKRIRSQDWSKDIFEKTWPVPESYQEQFKNDAFNALLFCDDEIEKHSLGLRKRYLILKRDNFKCNLCGISAIDGLTLEIDHKLPKSQGGKNTNDNLWTLCYDCNRGKSDILLDGYNIE